MFSQKSNQKNAIQNYIQQFLLDEVSAKSIPDKVIKYQENAMLDYYLYYAGIYGMELEDLISYDGFSNVDELMEASRDDNMTSAALSLILQAIAEDAGLSVSEDDLAGFFLEYYGSGDYSMYEDHYGLPYLKQAVLHQKVFDFIIENAVLL